MVNIKLYAVELKVNSFDSYDTYCNNYTVLAKKVDGTEPFKLLPLITPDDGNGYHHRKLIDCESDDIILTAEQYLDLLEKGIDMKLKQTIVKQVDPALLFSKVNEKSLEQIELPSGNTYNNKCEVHMPGSALATYNDMMLLEDACTDQLQGALNSGWRIVAACPQPDQHRPDYILGRFNPEQDEDGSARRG